MTTNSNGHCNDLRLPGYNRIILDGRLGRDFELEYTQSGTPYAKNSLCNTRHFKSNGVDHTEDCWIDIVVWRKLAEAVPEWFRKGRPVLIEGRLRQNTWTDQEGKTRSKHELNVDYIWPLTWDRPLTNQGHPGAAAAAPQQGQQGQQRQPTPAPRPPQQQNLPPPPARVPTGPPLNEEDIPF